MNVSKSNCVVSNCESAETGISSMIIFIAAVLSTAVTAGVLLSMTNMLQQQAQETGERAILDVSTSIKIMYITGDRKEDSNPSADTSDTIQVVELNVELASGSPDIKIENVLITITDGTKYYTLSFNTTGTTAEHADSQTYVATAVRDEDSSFTNDHIISEGDLIKILISTDASATNLNLEPSTSVTIRIILNQGTPTISKFTTPASYTKRYIELT